MAGEAGAVTIAGTGAEGAAEDVEGAEDAGEARAEELEYGRTCPSQRDVAVRVTCDTPVDLTK